MTTNFTTAVCTSRANALVTAAGSGCTLKIYSGAAPTSADTATSGTLLVTLTIAGVLGTVSSVSGVATITLGAVTSGTAVATATAGTARLATSGGTTICDFTTVGTSGADLNLASTTITSGITVSVTSGTISEAYP